MNIILKQFDKQMVTPKDDAILYDLIINDSGLIEGGNLTYIGANKIRISSTRGIIKGRMFTLGEQEITVDYSTGVDWPGRIYLHMDLMNHDNPLEVRSITAAALPPLVKNEKCNYEDGIYEIELGTYKASQVALTEVKKTAHILSNRAGKDDLQKVVDNLGDQIVVTVNGAVCSIERV